MCKSCFGCEYAKILRIKGDETILTAYCKCTGCRISDKNYKTQIPDWCPIWDESYKKTDTPKFSVIVPAYNSENYISKGLQSINDQTFKDYELIVVCDSCLDHTADIASSFGADVYEVSFHQDGQTRNVGLDHAKGEWILFMDDDDWFLHEYAFQMLANSVGKNGEDIFMFSSIWKNAGYARNTPERYLIAVWNKAWRREFIGDTRFSDVKYTSDLDFHNAMLAKHPKTVVWDMPFYYHDHMREGSQTDEQKKLGLI